MMQLRRFLFGETVRQTGVALIDQVLNSAVNFLVGVALIRATAASDYGSWVLANAALLLAVGFQHAVIVMPMTVLAAKRSGSDRIGFVGALATTQFALWIPPCLLACLGAGVAASTGALDATLAPLVMTTAAVTVAIVAREFFRQTFFVFGVPQLTLVVDAVYGVTYLALIGFWVRHAGQPAAAAVLAAGIASLVAAGAGLVFYRVRLGGSLVIDFGPLRETWAPAKWGVPGMLLAWLQNQGFFYLLGGFLGTTAVATVSASRMLLMPIPMLITAVESVLRPRAADWVGRREFARLTRQLLAMTGTAAVASAGFVGVIFAARHFVVEVVLRRTIDDLDLLLVCWGVVFLAQVLRTNITVLLQALERFDVLFYLTVVRGVISFSLGWLGMIVIGAPGILVGLAIGEVAYVATGAAAARRQLREAKR